MGSTRPFQDWDWASLFRQRLSNGMGDGCGWKVSRASVPPFPLRSRLHHRQKLAPFGKKEEGSMGKRILVVDDDAAIGEVLQLMLEGEGYDVDIQADGQIAQQMQQRVRD